MRRHILIVDDEPNILNSLQRLLDEEGYCVHRAKDGQDGLQILASTPEIGVILSDQRMPQMTGIEFLRAVKSNHASKVRMILSGYSELQTLTEAINEGSIFKFVCKPWDDDQLLNTIKEAFEYYELSQKNRLLSEELIETNHKLEKLNSELETKVNEKTHKLELHIASLKVHQDALEYFPYSVVGLDSDLFVVLENAKARTLLTRTANSALGLHISQALQPEFQYALPEIDRMMHTEDLPTSELTHGDSRLQIHRLGSEMNSLGLLLIALPR